MCLFNLAFFGDAADWFAALYVRGGEAKLRNPICRCQPRSITVQRHIQIIPPGRAHWYADGGTCRVKLPPGMHCSLEFRLSHSLLVVIPLVSRRYRALATQSYRRPRRFPALLTTRFSISKPAREPWQRNLSERRKNSFSMNYQIANHSAWSWNSIATEYPSNL